MGQNAQQVREEAGRHRGDYLLQVPAGIITGAIARGVGRSRSGKRQNHDGSERHGAKSGITGNVASRAAKGILSEGVLQEVPQSAQEQAWQNLATGKPLQEGVGEQAVQGLVAGGAMGGGAELCRRLHDPQEKAAPLQRAVASRRQRRAGRTGNSRSGHVRSRPGAGSLGRGSETNQNLQCLRRRQVRSPPLQELPMAAKAARPKPPGRC